MSLIARLGVILGINTSEFTSGIDNATKKTREFEMNQRRALKNAQRAQDEFMQMAGKGFLAVSAAALAVGKAFQYADQIEDTAKAFDVATVSLMAMQAAFVASGGDMENASGALQKLAIAQQGARDGSDELREAFTKLGISGKDVEELELGELFKRVAFELSKVEDATKRTALQTELLGKAVKGTNWKDFVNNYKELGDPALLYAVQENAKAWGNIEATFKELLNVAQKLVYPFALIVNSIADIRNEYDRLKKGGSGEVDFGIAFGGMPGEAIVGEYGEPTTAPKDIAKPAQQGDYKEQTEKQKNAAKKSADEARRMAEARRNLQIEIGLLVKKAGITSNIYDLNLKAIRTGEKSVAEERLRLDLANSLVEIRAAAAKERAKENAQIDLINKKEAAQIATRLAQYNADEKMRVQAMQRQHQLMLRSIKEELDLREEVGTIEASNQLDFLDLEKERFVLGSDAYELKKLDIETQHRLAEINFRYLQQAKAINKEYELSGKSLEDFEILEAKLLAMHFDRLRETTWATKVEETKKEVLEAQVDLNKKLLELDLERQKTREVSTIEYQLNADRRRLEIEAQRYEMTVNEYNMNSMLLDNANALIEAERKYNEMQQEAYYEMQRQGGGQKAREQYEMRMTAINEIKNAELNALKEVNARREENLQKDILRQQSWVAGWKYAAMRYQENSIRAFDRGERVFGQVMSNMNTAISNFVDTGKFKFGDFAAAIIKDILRMEMQAQAASLFRSLMQFAGIGARAITSVNYDAGIRNIPMAAKGGDIDGPTIVGELGPELFIPKTSGTVIPNNRLSSMSNMAPTNYVTNNYINAIDVKSFEERILSSSNAVWAANKYADKSLQVGRGRT